MENKNSDSKKINKAQDLETSDPKLNKEVDIDADGNKIVVDRAREANESTEGLLSEIDSENPNAKRGVTTDKEAMKTVENKDLNSDITANRYPKSNPESHEDRGNMKLDE